MRAEIYIEDTDQGVDMSFRFIDGINLTSGAHQLANRVKAYLDSLVAEGSLTAVAESIEPVEQGTLLLTARS